MRKINSKITSGYNEGIMGAKTVKSLVVEEKNFREFASVTEEMRSASIKAARLNAIYIPLVVFFGALATALVLERGGIMVLNGSMDIGTLAAFTAYAVGIFEPIQRLAGILSQCISAQANIERVTSLLEEKPQVVDSPEVLEKYGDFFDPHKENWEPIKGDIEFENVSFQYPDGKEEVLSNFNLKIPAGTNVAIVGETGAGKSTLVNLACRFFEPTKGRILIDDRDYRERSQLWLHSNIGYVLQNPHLFSGTVMENIRYGRLDATDEEVKAAAKAVHADEVAEKLDKGYDSDVGEGGDRLSTGEKQLLSFARAVLADPAIFVLDEATSSIDTKTEQLIQQATDKLLKGRTSFLIAHRLSTIRNADLITLGPGSLYTSVLPDLLVPEILTAIRESSAPCMYICNVMTQPGETLGYTVSDHLKALVDHVGKGVIDYVLVNNGVPKKDVLKRYEKVQAHPVEIDRKKIQRMGIILIEADLLGVEKGAVHDTDTLCNEIIRISGLLKTNIAPEVLSGYLGRAK